MSRSPVTRALALVLVLAPLTTAHAQAARTPAPASARGAARAAPLAGLDAYVRQAMKDWQGAGLSIAIVKDDSVVFAGGYGVREVGKPAPVTPRTIFAIGSNTKLFTAVAAGMMVDEGKLRWDAPVTTYLPWFQLHDPYVTREITVRDMLSHRSGLGRRGDLIWYGSPFSRKEILTRIRYLEPNSSFRSEFGYQNIMVLGAGEAVAAVAGQSWDDLVERRILQPLGMRESSTSIRALASASDVAAPHDWRDGRPVSVPWRDIDNVAPAGSINSSALDMAQWIRFLLADGSHGGRSLIKPATLREIESPQTIVRNPPDSLRPSMHFSAYGLGVGMHDYLGVKVMTHTGGIDGMLSQVTWVPERKLGVVILTNTSGHNALFTALANRVLDAYLGAPPRDWSRILLDQTVKQESQMAATAAKAEAARAKDTKPSLALEKYAGTYVSELYPDLVFGLEGGALVVRFGTAFSGRAEHWQYDTFRLLMPALGSDSELATFMLDSRGAVARVDVEGIGEFIRKPVEHETAVRP
jgi:CubicO group peptidase (beta-lactamase class C family)